MKKTILLFLLVLTATELNGVINPFAKWTKTDLILCNAVVRRTIKLPTEGGRFIMVGYKPLNGSYNAFSDTCTDFQFELNDIIYSGRGRWTLVNIQMITDDYEGL